jgi:predicted nuclease of predicted toxin-antitoxin system
MKLIIDAQLPRRMGRWLSGRGHDVLHTLDLPRANATSDAEIIDLACRESRIVVTKDGDFVDSFLVHRRPPKLLWVTTGNMSNVDLLSLLERNWTAIEGALADNAFVELGHDRLVVHQ